MIQQIESLKLSAQKRENSGSRQAQRLRKNGWLPGIVYDSAGKSAPIQTKRHEFEVLLRNQQGQNIILDLEIEGEKTCKVLLKDIQQDRIKDHLLHVDFLEISMTRKLRVSVPVTLAGEPVGVTQQGGVMEHLLRSVEIECLPGDIVKEFVLDVSGLAIGDTLSVRDIKADPKITILTMSDIAVVSVQLPHFEEEAKPAEEAAEGAVEGAAPAEGEAAAAAEPGKEAGKEGKEKEGAAPEKGKEAKEKGKESKGKESKEKTK
ncbi:MAG: 50S ribosomal protein L25 [Kiritimatiellae bacterium]|nr:50S ribosomal protein L25 [Kiritimatiellia bacterium]